MNLFPISFIQNLEHWIQRIRKESILKFCGAQWLDCGFLVKLNLLVLGCLLQPDSLVFISNREAPLTTLDLPWLNPFPWPSCQIPTCQNFALWAWNLSSIQTIWVNSCLLIILLGIARTKWELSEIEQIQRFKPNTFVTFSLTWHLSSRFYPCLVVCYMPIYVKVINEPVWVRELYLAS